MYVFADYTGQYMSHEWFPFNIKLFKVEDRDGKYKRLLQQTNKQKC